MEPRRNVLEIFAEALHDRDRVARHSVIGCPCTPAKQRKNGKDDDAARAPGRHDLLQPILAVSDQVFKIGTGFGPAIPGVALAAALPWHRNVLSRAAPERFESERVFGPAWI